MQAHQPKMPIPVASEQQVEWDDLRLLLAIIRHHSIRAAAAKLALNPSTLSRRLANLEHALGARLFERHPTGLKLTLAGQEAALFGTQLEDEVRDLKIRLARQEQEVEGLLRVTSAEVIGDLSCQFAAQLLQSYPRLELDLKISDAMMSVERHEVDIAIRVADAPPEDLVGRRVGRSAVGLYASKSYLQRFGHDMDAPEHHFVEWPAVIKHKPAFQWLDKHYPKRHKITHCNSANAVLACVRAGLGIAPLGMAQAVSAPDLTLLRRLPATCSTAVWLLAHKDLRSTARVRAALDFLGDAFKKNQHLLEPTPL